MSDIKVKDHHDLVRDSSNMGVIKNTNKTEYLAFMRQRKNMLDQQEVNEKLQKRVEQLEKVINTLLKGKTDG